MTALHHQYRDREDLALPLDDLRLERTQSWQGMVTEFHTKFDGVVSAVPTVPSWTDRNKRYALIAEEFNELADELLKTRPDVAKATHEAADLIYSTLGAFVEFGVEADEVIRLVHVANMSKTNEGRGTKPSKGAGFKPATFDLADVSAVVNG